VSDERVIEYLRFRGQAQPPTDLVPRIVAAVDAAPVSRSPFAALIPAAVAVGVLAVVAIVALILGQEPNVGPGPTESTEAQPSPASVEELQAAIESGLDMLREAPGVEGIGTSSVLGELSAATWFSWRPNGDQTVISRSDIDVSETAWWLQPEGQPPARGENVTTTIHVLVGDEYFVADAETWDVQARADAPSVLSFATAILDADPLAVQGFTGNLAGEATVTRNADESTTWSLTAPHRDGSGTSEWQVAADGSLVSWSMELVGVTPTVEDAPFVTHQQVEFIPVPDASPIEAPDTESLPDPAALGLPADFPLGQPGSSTDVDYVAYIETALEAMEAYHWNTEAIDWAAARAAAFDGLPDAPTAGEAWRRIQDAIATFDFSGTVFIRPEDVPAGGEGPGSVTAPRGDRLGDVGYLDLPALDAGSPDDVLSYMQDGWTAIASIESTAPACGWIIDVRDTAFGAYPPLFGVVAGLLGEGRVITFDSALGDWWVDVNDDGTLLLGGEERSADILESPAVAAATADEERQNAEFVAMLAGEAPHMPGDPDAPVVVLTSNVTAVAGEQLVVGFRGRPATRVIGSVTSGSPHGQMSLAMVDGARLRFQVSTVVDRAGTTYDSNLVPDENVAVLGGPDGDDPAIEAAVDWLEGQPGCS